MKNKKQFSFSFLMGVLFVLAVIVTACTTINPEQQAAINKALSRQVYGPTTDIEFNNYNDRNKLADDPSTIIWCTSAFSQPGAPMFTVPIHGKLTSGNKRPFPTSLATGSTQGGYDTTELPDAWGMYGTSGEYRYGFTPAHKYWDFYNMQTVCTDEPTIWQRTSTTIVLQTDPTLLAAQQKAQDLLKQGKNQEAEKVLQDAINSIQGGK